LTLRYIRFRLFVWEVNEILKKQAVLKKNIWPPNTDERAFKWRWLTIALGPTLFLFACWRGEFLNACLSCAVGVIYGFFIDIVGGKLLNFYRYPRIEFLSKDYFKLLPPAWGLFGMMVNLPWNWFAGEGIQLYFLAPFTVLFITLYELPNYKAVSWQYNIAKWVVILGWIFMMIIFRITFLLSIAALSTSI